MGGAGDVAGGADRLGERRVCEDGDRALCAPGGGAGVFVADAGPSKSFEINLSEAEKLQEVLSVLELRRGVEVEAVGLAASRRTEEDLVRLEACYDKVGEEIVAGGHPPQLKDLSRAIGALGCQAVAKIERCLRIKIRRIV